MLIGSWVPGLLFLGGNPPHIGIMDADLALNHKTLTEESYRTIRNLLLDRGYQLSQQPYIFLRKVTIGDKSITVQVDFLAGEYGGTGKTHRHQRIQNIMARKVRGCDLAFDFEIYARVSLKGPLPSGAHDEVTVKAASVVPFKLTECAAAQHASFNSDNAQPGLVRSHGVRTMLATHLLPILRQHAVASPSCLPLLRRRRCCAHWGWGNPTRRACLHAWPFFRSPRWLLSRSIGSKGLGRKPPSAH